MDLSTFLTAATKLVAAGIQHEPEIVETFHQAIAALHPQDQETAKAALADIEADNDEGYARLDAKLAAAEKE